MKPNESRPSIDNENPSISYKSVKSFARKYNLPNKDVYELGTFYCYIYLVTQYNSMVR